MVHIVYIHFLFYDYFYHFTPHFNPIWDVVNFNFTTSQIEPLNKRIILFFIRNASQIVMPRIDHHLIRKGE